MDNRKINGFNNGRDASSGVGGGKSSFEIMAEQAESLRKIWENPKPYIRKVTIRVPEGSFIATPHDDKDDIREKFEAWIREL